MADIQEVSEKIQNQKQQTLESDQRPNNLHHRRLQFGIRHDNNKKRFPPNKKEEATKKQSNERKNIKNKNNPLEFQLIDQKNENKGTQAPKFIHEVNNSLDKSNLPNSNNTFGTYHAVGQSQREKLLGTSPTPHNFVSQTNQITKQPQQ